MATTRESRLEVCSFCRFRNEVGECHRHPPAIVVLPDGYGNLCTSSAFPIVRPSEWCGEFEREDDKEPTE